MTTQEIANRLVELCRQGQHETAYKELFSPNAVGIEPAKYKVPDTVGIDALLAKSKGWNDNVIEMHELLVSDPLVAGDYFTVTMTIDTTTKSSGRSREEEICLYEVNDGKIIKESFFH